MRPLCLSTISSGVYIIGKIKLKRCTLEDTLAGGRCMFTLVWPIFHIRAKLKMVLVTFRNAMLLHFIAMTVPDRRTAIVLRLVLQFCNSHHS